MENEKQDTGDVKEVEKKPISIESIESQEAAFQEEKRAEDMERNSLRQNVRMLETRRRNKELRLKQAETSEGGETKVCLFCKAEFKARGGNYSEKKFCSVGCRSNENHLNWLAKKKDEFEEKFLARKKAAANITPLDSG